MVLLIFIVKKYSAVIEYLDPYETSTKLIAMNNKILQIIIFHIVKFIHI